MNSLNPISSINTPHTGAFEAWCNATSLQCLVDAIKRIWDGVLELLQQIYSFLTCAGLSTEPCATTPPLDAETQLLRSPDLPASPEVQRASVSLRNHLAQLGGAAFNAERLTTMVIRLARDLLANDLLADVDDLVQSNNIALLNQSLQEFLRTEDSAGVIEAVRQIVPTRYAGFQPRYPIALPELDARFSRWDLLYIKRFHFWLNSIPDSPTPLEDLQRLIPSANFEIKGFVALAHRLKANRAWDIFLDAISHDRVIVKRLAFDIPRVIDCNVGRDLYDDLQMQYPIAFPSGANPAWSEYYAQPINEEERNLISDFQLWLRDNIPTINAEVDLDRYLGGLYQELAAQAGQDPDQLRGVGERYRRYRSFALIVKSLQERQSFQNFCRHLRFDETLVALLPEAIRSGNLVPLYQELRCDCSDHMRTLISWIENPRFYEGSLSPTIRECVRLADNLRAAHAWDRFLTLIYSLDSPLVGLPRIYLDELLPGAMASGNIEPILAAMNSLPLRIVQTISPYPVRANPNALYVGVEST